MIGESNTLDLTDINLQLIKKYNIHSSFSKKSCFLRDEIIDINYTHDVYECNQSGKVNYSTNIYINKHMNYLGLPYYTNKMIKRYERSHKMREGGMGRHYINNVEDQLNKCTLMT